MTIAAYVREGSRITAHRLESNAPVPDGTVWLDLFSLTEEEAANIGRTLGIEIPSREDIREIEASSRLYTDNGHIYLTTPIVVDAETKPVLRELACILTRQMVLTVRYATPKSIATYADRLGKQPELTATPVDTLLSLLDAVIDRQADVLEMVGGRIDRVAEQIFEHKTQRVRSRHRKKKRSQTDELQDILRELVSAGELSNKVRTSVSGMDRLLAYLATVLADRPSREQQIGLKTLNRDLRSLSEHVAFLANESNFLLDATLGMISIQQNNIITIFSIVAVIFLPPTLIASIYGMNFIHMPELEWPVAYPLVLVAMILSAILPVIYFRWKRWL